NSGYRNSGNHNSGMFNQGDYNSGDFNISDNNTGCFNTVQHTIKIFDADTDMTLEQWRRSDAYKLLRRIDYTPTTWVWDHDMTDEEKEKYPSYKTTEGYLRQNDLTQVYQNWWNNLDDEEKEIIEGIPNFDADKFKLITSIDVGEGQ
ncbi:pentapeptide repeat-containing protein, partial [Lysinibacillus sphaericus]|uniref:pentapeptide repeat-containing protein n=1 Tax=Lysinibacillus sphaericus TaxID=1421 RepID=UPI000B07AABC